MDVQELQQHVGESLGTGDWLEVTQEMIQTFADVTRDDQWIHTDPERAREGPFGTTVAHGYLTMSLVPVLARSAISVEGVAMGVNYGLNKCRFPAPVKSGSRIRGEFTLLSAEPQSDGSIQVVLRATVTAEGQDKPSCVAETVSRYYPA